MIKTQLLLSRMHLSGTKPPIFPYITPILPFLTPILPYITLHYPILPYIALYYPSLHFPYPILRHPIVKNYVYAGVFFAVNRFSCWILLYKLIVSFSIKDIIICNVNSENGFSQQHKRFLTRYVSVIFFWGFLWPVFLHYTCINFAIAVSDHINNNF